MNQLRRFTMSKKKNKFKPDYVIEKHGNTYIDPKSVYCPECGHEMKYATNSGTTYWHSFYDRTVYKTFYRCPKCKCEISKKTKQKPKWHKATGFAKVVIIVSFILSVIVFGALCFIRFVDWSNDTATKVQTSWIVASIVVFLISGFSIDCDWG
jgi:hypothetical protein